ncbi:MAG: TetR/AcrR family transcriptional regulator [Dysgonamonadaceae bacterium]|jgi:AcrR family transcriptional regulator|nr:TetR/AcrR family transcriptional regulator [Dysgonamonadaceae bacterium]
MELKQANTEQTILHAAEKLFIEKGYTGTRTTEIAEAAGVNHAMLHYYFRTKEKLFDRIFNEKTSSLLDCFFQAFDNDRPFLEQLKSGIEQHFDYIVQVPALPFFILRELIQSEERKTVVRKKIAPVAFQIMERMSVSIRKEVTQGTIQPIHPQDLLLNIVSLNVFAFVAMQLFFDVKNDSQSAVFKQFLEQRKQNNIETIINSIKI